MFLVIDFSISAFALPVEWIESDYQALILVAVFLACFALFWGILRAGFIFARYACKQVS